MQFGANEILTRQQLKNTIGGYACLCQNAGPRPPKLTQGANETILQFKARVIARCGAGNFTCGL